MAARLVIFDCDGVLVDSEYVIAELEAELLATVGLHLTPAEIAEAFVGLSEPDLTALIRERWGINLDAAFHAEKRRRIELALTDQLEAVDGIVDVLGALDVPACVASSSRPERLRLSLALTGLEPWFGDRVYSALSVARGKPAPDLFLHAAARSGVAPARCLVVEDSPYGVEAGVAAGMAVIGFTAGRHCGPGSGRRLRDAGAAAVAASGGDLQRALGELSARLPRRGH